MEVIKKDTGVEWKNFCWSKLKQFGQNKVALDYNSKYKINIQESMKIQINGWINK